MKLLAFDPGKRNFAYAVLHDGRCIEHGTVRTVTGLADGRYDAIAQFRRDVDKIFARHRFAERTARCAGDVVAFERMQHRPNVGGGAVVEYVNLMLGMVVSRVHDARLRLYPVLASMWKRHYGRMFGYAPGRLAMLTHDVRARAPAGSGTKTKTETIRGIFDGQPRASRLNEHEADAVGIACYAWFRTVGIEVIGRVLLEADESNERLLSTQTEGKNDELLP